MWFKGTEKEWDALSNKEQSKLSLKETGCLFARPTWQMPIDCSHLQCQVARGEKPQIALTEGILYGERECGWLRFLSEERYQQVKTALLKRAEELGIYDPWKLPGGWQVIVGAGLEK